MPAGHPKATRCVIKGTAGAPSVFANQLSLLMTPARIYNDKMTEDPSLRSCQVKDPCLMVLPSMHFSSLFQSLDVQDY